MVFTRKDGIFMGELLVSGRVRHGMILQVPLLSSHFCDRPHLQSYGPVGRLGIHGRYGRFTIHDGNPYIPVGEYVHGLLKNERFPK